MNLRLDVLSCKFDEMIKIEEQSINEKIISMNNALVEILKSLNEKTT